MPTAVHLEWLRRWRTSPDLARTVKGSDRDYLEPGAVYQGAFQDLLLRMEEERVLGTVPAPQSSRFTGTIRTAPARTEAERRETAERIRALAAGVDAAKATDPERGRKRFETLCAGYHSVRNDGAGFGPSLAESRNRTTEAILTAVIDPSQAVEGVFRPFQIETTDGGTLEGFFGEETADSRTLRFGQTGRLRARTLGNARGTAGRARNPGRGRTRPVRAVDSMTAVGRHGSYGFRRTRGVEAETHQRS
jgi:putative heme-binding domain-containing protein